MYQTNNLGNRPGVSKRKNYNRVYICVRSKTYHRLLVLYCEGNNNNKGKKNPFPLLRK